MEDLLGPLRQNRPVVFPLFCIRYLMSNTPILWLYSHALIRTHARGHLFASFRWHALHVSDQAPAPTVVLL